MSANGAAGASGSGRAAGAVRETGPAQAIEAELTWTGERFERGVRVTVGAGGRIEAVERAGTLPSAGTDPPAGSAGASRPTEPAVPAEPGESRDSTAVSPAGDTLRLPGRALLPGFVNVHSHAFQRGLRGLGETFPAGAGSFWTWREAMYGLVGSLDRERLRALSLAAFREMRAAGITAVGEFHYLHHEEAPDDETAADWAFDRVILDAAREAGVRIVLLQACYMAGGFGRPLEPAQRRFQAPSLGAYWEQVDRLAGALDPATQTLGVAAHSLRAVPLAEVAALHAEARRRGLAFHLHLEEQRREIEECLAAYGARPMALILRELEVGPETTAVHCTHSDPEELSRLATAGGNVCVCPLTEANLGDGIPPLAAAPAAAGRVCLGTDSNARIAMIEEMRWLEYGQRLAGERRGALADRDGRLAPRLLTAATAGGARALGLPAGAIAPGRWGDFAAIDLGHPALAGTGDDTLAEALVTGGGNGVIAATCVGGRWREETAPR